KLGWDATGICRLQSSSTSCDPKTKAGPCRTGPAFMYSLARARHLDKGVDRRAAIHLGGSQQQLVGALRLELAQVQAADDARVAQPTIQLRRGLLTLDHELIEVRSLVEDLEAARLLQLPGEIMGVMVANFGHPPHAA